MMALLIIGVLVHQGRLVSNRNACLSALLKLDFVLQIRRDTRLPTAVEESIDDDAGMQDNASCFSFFIPDKTRALVSKQNKPTNHSSTPPVSDLVEFSGNRGVKYGDGCVYQGEWVDGLEDGIGQLNFPSGDNYKGGFRRGLKNGRGLFIFANGDQFRGSFASNKKHGSGIYTWSDGDCMESFFVDGNEEGKATFTPKGGRKVEYYFQAGKEIPPPKDEGEQLESALNFKSLNFKSILSPGEIHANSNASELRPRKLKSNK
jgi:hypothetical protein